MRREHWEALSPAEREAVLEVARLMAGTGLSETARKTSMHLVRRLAQGYSGSIRMECSQGGVQLITEEQRSPWEDGTRTVSLQRLEPRDL